MAPPKASKAGHDDGKAETTTAKEKNGHAAGSHQSNGKLRRVASNTGSQQKETPNAGAGHAGASAAAAPGADAAVPGLQWGAFDRDVLHSYRREYRLNTPTSFAASYHQLVLSQPGSIGLHSPTMARRKAHQRQSREHLALAVRKHFNGLGIQENDVVVELIHKLRSDGGTKPKRSNAASSE